MEQASGAIRIPKNINRIAYGFFVLIGTIYIFRGNYSQACVFWGLALVFDPFDHQTTFSKRPFYQRAWLIVHVLITISMFIAMMLKG